MAREKQWVVGEYLEDDKVWFWRMGSGIYSLDLAKAYVHTEWNKADEDCDETAGEVVLPLGTARAIAKQWGPIEVTAPEGYDAHKAMAEFAAMFEKVEAAAQEPAMASKKEQWVLGEFDAEEGTWSWVSGPGQECVAGYSLQEADRYDSQVEAFKADFASCWVAMPLAAAEAIVEHWKVSRAVHREVTVSIPGMPERGVTAKIVLSDKEAILADLARAADALEDE